MHCPHNRDPARCVRCDPWCPPGISEVQLDEWQLHIDRGNRPGIAKRFETLKLLATGFVDEHGVTHEPLISQSQFLDLLEAALDPYGTHPNGDGT